MSNESGGPQFELPPQPAPTPEKPAEQLQEKAVETQRPAKQEAGVGKSAPQPGSTAIDDQTAIRIPAAPPDTPSEQAKPNQTVSPATADLQAADADLIEKEWIVRTKSVTAQTRDDPHRQANEMSKVKVDYNQKRFKKIIKPQTDDAITA